MPQQAPTRLALTPRNVTWGGLVANAVLAAAKVLAGWLCRSQAILADGFHSASDLVTDVAVLAGLGISQKPADREHQYGHRRVSTLVAMFVGAGLLAVAALIIYHAAVTIRTPHQTIDSALPLVLAIVSIPVKEVMFHLTIYVGRRVGDVSLLANAWHHRSDAFTSVAAAVGLTVVAIGGPKWAFIDELTAMVLGAFLVVAAAQIIASSAGELIDRAPSRAALDGIEAAVTRTEGVRGFHAIRARGIGGKIAMDIHVLVDPELTVREGHDIATGVENSVHQANGDVIEVVVHVEASGDPDPANPPPAD